MSINIGKSELYRISDHYILSGKAVDKNSKIQHFKIISAYLRRPFDVMFSLSALLITSPIFLVIALLIKFTSEGPIFFKQKRVGKNGRYFTIYKFRTMNYIYDDAAKSEKQKSLEITPVGHFLRQTSLDEIPQFINVLNGTMSVVGPRPHIPNMKAAGQFYENVVPNYHARHVIKPGITGLAQVSGFRGDVSSADAQTRYHAQMRIYLDQQYIKNATLWLDIQIIMKTIFKEFIFGSGK